MVQDLQDFFNAKRPINGITQRTVPWVKNERRSTMKPSTSLRYLLLPLAVLFLVVALGPISGGAENPQFQLTILHTNDFHGADFTLLAREATMIKKIRTEVRNLLYLEAGDTFTRGPFHTKFYGELEFAVLNAVGCDALTLGNNEFKATEEAGTSQAYLFKRINEAKFPILSANLKLASDGSYLPKVQPFIIKTIQGIRVGILGLSAWRIDTYPQAKGFIVENPLTAGVEIFPKVAAGSDLVMALTHIGYFEDRQLAAKLPKLAAIIGGDSHTVLKTPDVVGGIPIVQAGDNGRFLGRLDLTFEKKDGVWVLKDFQGKLIPMTAEIPEDAEIKALIQSFMAQLHQPAA